MGASLLCARKFIPCLRERQMPMSVPSSFAWKTLIRCAHYSFQNESCAILKTKQAKKKPSGHVRAIAVVENLSRCFGVGKPAWPTG